MFCLLISLRSCIILLLATAPVDTAGSAEPRRAVPEPPVVPTLPKLNGDHGTNGTGPVRSALPAAADPEIDFDIDLRLEEWFARRERPAGSDVDLRSPLPDHAD